MHARSACDQWTFPGQCNACCVAVEFIHGVRRHLMTMRTQYYVVFVFKPPTEVAFLFVFTMC